MWPFRRKRKAAHRPQPTHGPAQAELPHPIEPPAPQAARPTRTADDILKELEAQAPKAAPAPRREAPKPPADPNIGRCLLAEGPITSEFLRQQIAVSGATDTYLGRLLASVSAPGEAELLELLAAGYRMPQVDLKQCRVPVAVARSVPREVALKYKMVPIARIGDLLCVAFAGEPNPKGILAIRKATGLRVKVLRCPAHHVRIVLRRLFQGAAVAQALVATPITEQDYDDALRGPEARWERLHATKGPVRAERLGHH